MPNQNVYKGAVCRGCWALGNNCGSCERCIATKPDMSLAYEGAREDLDIWKKRALEAEAKLKETQTELSRWREDANWSRERALNAEAKLRRVNTEISDITINFMFNKLLQQTTVESFSGENWFMIGCITGHNFLKEVINADTN